MKLKLERKRGAMWEYECSNFKKRNQAMSFRLPRRDLLEAASFLERLWMGEIKIRNKKKKEKRNEETKTHGFGEDEPSTSSSAAEVSVPGSCAAGVEACDDDAAAAAAADDDNDDEAAAADCESAAAADKADADKAG